MTATSMISTKSQISTANQNAAWFNIHFAFVRQFEYDLLLYRQSKFNVIIAITLSLMMISTLLKQRSDIVSLCVFLPTPWRQMQWMAWIMS